MKVSVYDLKGSKAGEVSLPAQFEEPVREDLIKRAVLAQQSNSYQPYGSDPRAGTKQGNPTPKRRRKYKTTYGHGESRVARKYSWHRGVQFGYIGAFVVSAVGGHRAFPPQVNKSIFEKINVKERQKAIRSAISATAIKELVGLRNHKISRIDALPLVVEDKLEALSKAKDVKQTMEKLGLKEELARTAVRKIRAGKGKMRGRKHRTKAGPLLVVSKKCSLAKAARNIPGVEVVNVHDLSAEKLAPGTQPGRLTVWSKSAIEVLGKEGLFK